MQESLFVVYYSCLIISVITGSIRYRKLDGAMRLLVVLLFTIALCELIAFLLFKAHQYTIRPVVYHISCVLRLILVTIYFIKLLKLRDPERLIAAAIVIWPLAGGLNIIFLQPPTALNTNMVMMECFIVISMSLYSIYDMIRKDQDVTISANAHFWIAVLWLVLFSSTFFFWAFIKILYKNHWSYMDMVLCLQVIINIIVYSGIALVLFFYPKMNTLENR